MADPAPWLPVPPPDGTAPSEADVRRRADFEGLIALTPAGVQKSAEKWSAGIIAVIGAISALLLVKGQSSLDAVAPGWRWVLAVLSVLALVGAVAALWLLLGVSARRFRSADRSVVLGAPGALDDARVRSATEDALRVGQAIRLGGLAVVAQVAAVVCWFLAPAAPKAPPGYLSVTLAAEVICGELVSADGQTVRLKVAGYDATRVVPLGDVVNLSVVASCSS